MKTPKQIKQQNDIVRVIRKYLTLERKGTRWIGLCPFHEDHHPSLTVDPNKQTFTCYACGTKGDVITFIQKIKNCNFMEALNQLTIDNGQLTMNKTNQFPKKARTAEEQAVVTNYANFLPFTPDVPGLGETYAEFGVSQAPHTLSGEWKMMAGRIIFPIHNEKGILAGYSGRGEKPKYLNTPGLPRNQLLYGFHRAKQKVKETGVIYLVEGFKDVLAMHAAGFTNTAGICGTAFTTGQIKLLQKTEIKTVFLLLDGDEAGRKASEEICFTLYRWNILAIPVSLPDKEDPDSLFRKWGKEEFSSFILKNTSINIHFCEWRLIINCLKRRKCMFKFNGQDFPFPLVVYSTLKKEDILPLYPHNKELLELLAAGIPPEEMPQNIRTHIQDIESMEDLQCPFPDARLSEQEQLREILFIYSEDRLVWKSSQLLRRLHLADPNEKPALVRAFIKCKTQLQYACEYLGSSPAIPQ